MPGKNKHCLYLTLQHRGGKPGYHWALLLAPTLKKESSNTAVKDCYLFHVTNSIGQGHLQNETGNADWRYEDKPVNTMRSHTIISRIILAKISANTPLASVAEYIRSIVETIHIVQRDPNWTCRIWVEQALWALRAAGGEFSVIPVVTAGGEVEREIIEFGDGAMAKLASGKWNIQHPRDLPHGDMRNKQ
jgi:hypothetical protein